MAIPPGLAVSAVIFSVLILLKAILDLHIAPWLVRWLGKLPTRGLFRQKWTDLAGKWAMQWEAGGSEDFSDLSRRLADLQIWQFGPYCYGKFITGGSSYALFARVKEPHLVGDWYATKDKHGYFGVLQLTITSERELEGKWLGHSKRTTEVRADVFRAKKAHCQ